MPLYISHDWQNHLATPRAHIGNNLKIQLLLLLCVIWMIPGLIVHAPWKPLEALSAVTIKYLGQIDPWLTPLAGGELDTPLPALYYISARLSATLLQPWLALHDAARLSNVLWISLLLVTFGLVNKELWSHYAGRYSVLLMIASIGLVFNAHSLHPAIATMAILSLGMYALACYQHYRWRASLLLGISLFLSWWVDGIIAVGILLISCLTLPLVFSHWRRRAFISVLLFANALFITLWCLHAWWFAQYASLAEFMQSQWDLIHYFNHGYFLRILLWYAWPSTPLALWGLWHYRQQLIHQPKFQLLLVFFLSSWIVLGCGADKKDVFALPLLLPIVTLATGSIAYLQRNIASLLDWLGKMLFGTLGIMIWLCAIAMLIQQPHKLYTRLHFLSGVSHLSIGYISLGIALILSCVWLFILLRTSYSNRAMVTHWALGMTLVWSLLMVLCLPILDEAKSYQAIYAKLSEVLPHHYRCIQSTNLHPTQRFLLRYHTDIRVTPIESGAVPSCDLYLVRASKHHTYTKPDETWRLIWQGRRPIDRKEILYLYQHDESLPISAMLE